MQSESTPVLDVDLVVVGAGPAGLFAAYYAGFRGWRVAVVDSLPEVGGQIMAMYPEKPIYDVAGFPAVRGRDLVAGLKEQAEPFKPHYLLGHQATGLRRDADGVFTLNTAGGAVVTARTVVVTAGIGTFTPRPLPSCAGYDGNGLVYFVPEPQALAGQDVVIVGGGDSALDWARTLDGIARSVTLVHRRKTFRAHRSTVDKVLAAPGVEVLVDHQVVDSEGSPDLRSVCVQDAAGQRRWLDCQVVVAALGFVANLGPLAEWGIELKERHILVDSRMATTAPGVFAAGDITEYPGKVRLIAVGFGEAATAVNNAAALIDPAAPLFPGHSTDHVA
jgi:thioredoxin reductase